LPDKYEIEPYQNPYRWVILGLLWLVYAVFGLVIQSIAPLVTPILRDLDMSYAQMGLILGSWQLTYILVAIIAGTIIDKWGTRKSLTAGVVIIGISAALRYFPNGFGTMLLAVALFGVGGPLISVGIPKTVSVWFTGKNRGTAVGVYMTGPRVGGLLVLALTNSLVMPLTGYSWRLTFVCYGLLTIAVALLWSLLGRDARSTESTESTSMREVFGRIIRVRNVRVIFVIGLLAFVISHGFTNWLPKILEVGGLSPAVAGFAASIPIWIGTPTLVVVPHMVAPHARGRFIALSSVVVTISLLLLAMTSGIPLIIGLVIYGLAYAWVLPLLVLILMDLPEVGSKYMGSASGMYFCVAELGGFLGPLTVGAIKDWAGGFLAAVCFLAGLSFVRVFAALSLKLKPGRELEA